MAHFIADVEGGRGPASRTGTKNSGMTTHTRGWNLGVRVELRHEDGEDVAYVYRTGGSNGNGIEKIIAVLKGGK